MAVTDRTRKRKAKMSPEVTSEGGTQRPDAKMTKKDKAGGKRGRKNDQVALKCWTGAGVLIAAIFALFLGVAYFYMSNECLLAIHNKVVGYQSYLPDFVVQMFHDQKSQQVQKTNNAQKKGDADEPKGHHDWMKGPSTNPNLRLFTPDEIKYEEGGPMYLVLIGHVFDVTGAEFYKAGSGYHVFIGQDASRSFVTGEFEGSKISDDLEGLEPSDYNGLSDWLKFYLQHETYNFVGYVVGRYFDDTGKETSAMASLKGKMKWAVTESEKEGDLLKLFPTCNVEWTAETGSKLWCSNKSGGVDRDWVGYPRQFFEKGDKSPRCACVHANYLADPRVKEYLGCAHDSTSCLLPKTD